MSLLTPAELAALKKFDSPTISNAIEGFKVRPRNEGFMGPEIKCIKPSMSLLRLCLHREDCGP